VYIGTGVHWYGCTLVRVYLGTGVLNTLLRGARWYVGTLVRWYVGTLVRWYVGTLVRVYIGTGTGTGTGTGVRSNTLSPYFKGLNLIQHLKPLF